MKVGIIGSGGREHAICHALNNTKKIKQIYCFPGNAGTSEIAENISLNLENFNDLKDFITLKKIDLIVVGPEKPLVDGIVNFLEAHNIKVFGPSKLASQLEGSKIFTKNLCKKYNIPTAKFGVFQSIATAVAIL
jgi:phosphoribosylamine--glycine ligase